MMMSVRGEGTFQPAVEAFQTRAETRARARRPLERKTKPRSGALEPALINTPLPLESSFRLLGTSTRLAGQGEGCSQGARTGAAVALLLLRALILEAFYVR